MEKRRREKEAERQKVVKYKKWTSMNHLPVPSSDRVVSSPSPAPGSVVRWWPSPACHRPRQTPTPPAPPPSPSLVQRLRGWRTCLLVSAFRIGKLLVHKVFVKVLIQLLVRSLDGAPGDAVWFTEQINTQ